MRFHGLAVGAVVLMSGLSAAPILVTNSSNQLLRFDSAAPGSIQTTIGITGLQGGEFILGIDFRPANGDLFALGSTSRLYTVNQTTGAATQIGSAGAFTLGGTSFGFDFNPTVDRIRVVSDTGQNLRLNPNDGTLTSTDISLGGGGASGAFAAAYTNSFSGSATTTLYDIDSVNDALYTQNPPNNGVLNLIGPLGVNASSVGGFDIQFPGNIGFAALSVGGSSGLYSIDLSTGAATLLGAIGSGSQITGLAVVPDAVPEPGSLVLIGTALGALWAVRRRK